MSVNIDYAPVRETGNGVNLDFDFPFKIFNASDLVVSKILNSTEVETLMVLNVDYTIVINTVTEGGTVTYTVAPTALQDSYIRREMDITQEADIPTNNLFREVQIENALDKGTMIDQQQQVEIDRSIKIGELVIADPILPDPVAGKALMWNATADALINSTDDFNDIVTDATAAQVAAEAAQAAAQAAQAAAQLAETNAETAETNAETAETNAETAETNAELAETNAEAAQLAAENARDAALAAQTAAELAETNAETAETNAELAETNAETAETNAELAETNAETAETNAEAAQLAAENARDAAQNYALALTATSTTSLLISVASKVFTTQAGKQFQIGQWVTASSNATPSNYMHGQVTDYTGTSLTVNVTNIGGAGTLADWNISISGTRGTAGAAGSFIGLSDVPATFTGQTLKAVRVNAGETALEFYTPAAGSTYTRSTFTNASLTAGVLTITHTLGLSAPYVVDVTIFDNNGKKIMPDDVTGSANSVAVDLSSYGTLTGTWGYGYTA